LGWKAKAKKKKYLKLNFKESFLKCGGTNIVGLETHNANNLEQSASLLIRSFRFVTTTSVISNAFNLFHLEFSDIHNINF
jgi:hypothetical protein